jgi:hypothetical protein
MTAKMAVLTPDEVNFLANRWTKAVSAALGTEPQIAESETTRLEQHKTVLAERMREERSETLRKELADHLRKERNDLNLRGLL